MNTHTQDKANNPDPTHITTPKLMSVIKIMFVNKKTCCPDSGSEQSAPSFIWRVGDMEVEEVKNGMEPACGALTRLWPSVQPFGSMETQMLKLARTTKVCKVCLLKRVKFKLFLTNALRVKYCFSNFMLDIHRCSCSSSSFLKLMLIVWCKDGWSAADLWVISLKRRHWRSKLHRCIRVTTVSH